MSARAHFTTLLLGDLPEVCFLGNCMLSYIFMCKHTLHPGTTPCANPTHGKGRAPHRPTVLQKWTPSGGACWLHIQGHYMGIIQSSSIVRMLLTIHCKQHVFVACAGIARGQAG